MSQALRTGVAASALIAAIALSFPAWAQETKTQPAPKTPPAQTPPATPDTITVTGKKASSDIDRKSYDVKDNPQAQTGSAADALNTVPSVNVAPDGTVSVRGKTDVDIYVNGKPSTLLKGETRGDVLNALPGGNIEKIEVITNPSAQFRSSGGSILNIVTKKGKGLGGTLNLNLSTGSAGRYTFNSFGGLNEGKLSLNVSLSQRHDLRKSLNTSQRHNLQNGENLKRNSTQSTITDATNLYSGVEYRLNDNDSFETELILNRPRIDGRNTEYSQTRDASGVLIGDNVRLTHGRWRQAWSALNFGFDHKGATDDDRFKISLDNSTWLQRRKRDIRVLPLGSLGSQTFERQFGKNTSNEHTLTSDFSRSLGDGRKLSIGGVIESVGASFDTSFSDIDPLTGALTPRAGTLNHFEVDQLQSHAYLTFQANLGNWGYLIGARVENLQQTLNQVTTGVHLKNSYARLSPSLHLSRKLSDTKSLKASYSHRLQRPDSQALNPFLNYSDPQTATMGNPRLQPEESDKFELSYEEDRDKDNQSLAFFYSRSRHQLSDYSYYPTPNLLVTTQINAGSGQSGGVDIVWSRKFSNTLELNINTTLAYNEINSADASLRRSGTTSNGKVTLGYKPTTNSSYQATVLMQGDVITPQGSRSGTSQLNMSWRRKLNPKWSLILTGNDLLEGGRTTSVVRNTRVESASVSENQGRILFIGLSYTPFKPAGK